MSGYHIYTGTLSAGKDAGIYCGHFDQDSRTLTPFNRTDDLAYVSYIACSPYRDLMYAMTDIDGSAVNRIASYHIDRTTGNLVRIATRDYPIKGIAYLAVDHTGNTLIVSGYGSSEVVLVETDKAGRLGDIVQSHRLEGSGPVAARQDAPHPHCALCDRDNHFIFAPDLGADVVWSFQFNAASRASKPAGCIRLPAGSGPRHIAFHEDRRHAYMISELSCEVFVYNYDAAAGALTEIQQVTSLPEDYHGDRFGSDIRISAGGHLLYTGNREHNSVSEFEIAPSTGTIRLLRRIPTGGWPRNLRLTADDHHMVIVREEFRSSVGGIEIHALKEDCEPLCSAHIPFSCALEIVPAD